MNQDLDRTNQYPTDQGFLLNMDWNIPENQFLGL